jgi:hypothetical protein
VSCPACRAAVPSGAFCAICGTSLTVRPVPLATPWYPEVADHIPPPPAPTAEANSGRRLKVGAYGGAGLALLAAIAIVLGVPDRHTVSGDVQVSTSASDSLLGGDCVSPNGYDDVDDGASVVVEDETGRTLATSNLESGEYDGSSCVFNFKVEDVEKAAFYQVSVGSESRGHLQYSYDDMVDADWAVHLTLGN